MGLQLTIVTPWFCVCTTKWEYTIAGCDENGPILGRCKVFEVCSLPVINPLNPRAFCKKTRFLDILALFWLAFDHISFNLVKHASVTQQLAVLANSIAFYDILAWACAESKVLRWPTSLGRRFLNFFFRLSFFSFSFLFAAVIDLLLGLVVVKKLLRKRHRDGQILRWNSQV